MLPRSPARPPDTALAPTLPSRGPQKGYAPTPAVMFAWRPVTSLTLQREGYVCAGRGTRRRRRGPRRGPSRTGRSASPASAAGTPGGSCAPGCAGSRSVPAPSAQTRPVTRPGTRAKMRSSTAITHPWRSVSPWAWVPLPPRPEVLTPTIADDCVDRDLAIIADIYTPLVSESVDDLQTSPSRLEQIGFAQQWALITASVGDPDVDRPIRHRPSKLNDPALLTAQRCPVSHSVADEFTHHHKRVLYHRRRQVVLRKRSGQDAARTGNRERLAWEPSRLSPSRLRGHVTAASHRKTDCPQPVSPNPRQDPCSAVTNPGQRVGPTSNDQTALWM